MENNAMVKVFENTEFGKVRVAMKDGEPWFVGKDVAVALGYTDFNHTIVDHVDVDDRVNSKAQGQNDPEFGQRGTWLINESGVYSLVFGSKLDSARKFKHWVTSEVLPTIRKTGGFVMEGREYDFVEHYFPQEGSTIKTFLAESLKQSVKLQKELEVTNKKLTDTTTKLEAVVDAVVHWEDGKVINALVRRFASKVMYDNFGKAWSCFYKELLYKHGINLQSRQTRWADKNPLKKAPGAYKFLTDDEIGKAVSCMVALCEEAHIDCGDILNNFKAA